MRHGNWSSKQVSPEASFPVVRHIDRTFPRVLAQLELDFNSVERIAEYLEVPQEAPAIIPDRRPPAYWPSSNGELRVEGLEVKYAPDLPSVLHGISFTVHPAEKIGVVGRTGSGSCFCCVLSIAFPSFLSLRKINARSLATADRRAVGRVDSVSHCHCLLHETAKVSPII